MAGRSKETVYVSSTYEDLKDHRAALRTALEKAQYDVECMEKYAAFHAPPVDKCLADVAACDVYVLLIAHRYGYVPQDGNPLRQSITELEYEQALDYGKPCLVFCVQDKHPWSPEWMDFDEPARGRLKALRARVTAAHGAGFFTTPEDLASQVQSALQARQRPAAPPPAPDARRIPFELPPAANTYFGRSTQRADLLDRLRRGQSAAVVGAAGMGKTALAAVVLADLLGLRGERLADSPFPDGVVFLDLYALQAQPDVVWDRLASRLHGEAFLQRAQPRQRATEACRGRRELIVIEGAEVADGQTPQADLPTLLSVLSPENRTLVLTRSSAQVLPAQTVSLAHALAPEDAAALLDDLTRDTLAPDLRRRVLTLLQGHPLALHWAGNLLARDDDDPTLLIGDWERGALPSLSDPVQARHTLRWLFDRSARSLDAPARQALGLCGRLGAVPVPLALVEAGMGDGAREALKRLVQQGLMRREASLSAHWVFCHVLAHGYAREAIAAPEEGARRLADWLHRALPAALGSSARPCEVDKGAVGRMLAHAQALLLADSEGNLVRTIANVLLYSVSNRLGELGYSALVHRALVGVDAWFEQLLPAVAERTAMQRERAVLFSQFGSALYVHGDLTGALQAYRDGLAISERLARAHTTSAGRQRDLSVCYSNVGEVLQKQGDLAGALKAYRDGQKIHERLARADATNAGWQRDLSVSYSKMGGVLTEQGNLAGALKAYRDGQAIHERLVQVDVTNAGWQRDLSVSHWKVGGVLQAQGDLAKALQAYRDGLTISEQLARADATNLGWQNDLSVSHLKVGSVLQAQGDLANALQVYRDGLAISERLARTDAANAGWQRSLSVSHEKVGEVLQAQGDLTKALRAYQDALAISEQLARADATNAGWQRDLSVSYSKMGGVLTEQGNLAGALKAYRDGQAIHERLAQSDAMNAGWQRDLSVSHEKVGDVLQAQGDLAGALQAYQDGLVIRERLARFDETNAGWQRDLSVGHWKVGDVLQAQGELAGALQAYRDGLAISERLAQFEATNAGWQHDLSVSYEKMGEVLQAQGDLAGALQAYQDGLVIRERLARFDGTNAGWQRDLCVSHCNVGEVLQAQGDLAKALQAYREGLVISERLARADPMNAGWRCDVMRSSTRVADVHERLNDHVQALRYAEAALAIGRRLIALDATNQTWWTDTEAARVLVQRIQNEKRPA